MKQVHIPVALLVILLAAVVIGILVAGLLPKTLEATNNVEWFGGEPGVEFTGDGIAYRTDLELQESERFSLAFDLLVAPVPAEGFGFVLLLHGGRDSEQLVIGQWRSWLIAMNGTDYDYRRRMPRVRVDLANYDTRIVEIELRSGAPGTSLMVNGEVADRIETPLHLPGGGQSTTTLVLGNSLYASNPWWGGIGRLTIDSGLGTGPAAVDLDTMLRPLRHEILRPGFDRGSSTIDFAYDVVINFLGFIPFGVLLSALLLAVTDRSRGAVTVMTIICGAALSLGLELAQAWIPTRYSSLLDLSLNTLGTALGAVAASWFLRGGRTVD